MGYYKDEENTRKVITKDGWLNTGDLVWMAKGNNIVIVGREKETIVLSNGENIDLKASKMLVLKVLTSNRLSDRSDRPSLGALVVLTLTT
jgi:long-chain acyl-CoA synthetase